jgi:hypothetical protein
MTQCTTPDEIVERRLIWAGIWAILILLVQANACHYSTESADLPQVCLPFAIDAKGQTLSEHVQANPQFLLRLGP